MISVGDELDLELIVWRKALREVPDDYLQRAYDHAADTWDWHDKSHPFTADAIKLSYTQLLKEDRDRIKHEREKEWRQNPDTYKCWHCLDIGYQQVFWYLLKASAWYSAVTACSCELAPPSQRNLKPLELPRWIRNKLGQYVLRDDLEQYGAPNESFKSCIKAGEGGSGDA